MPAPQASDIGPLYDFLLATRDGTTLACLDRNGKSVNVSQIAYMSSIDKNNPQKEATELQEKSQLIQFATANLIDREFDQWPQVTQGDWSSGVGQRVYGSNGISTQYYDGQGLIWPLNDWQPGIPFAQGANNPPGSLLAPIFRGTAGGFVFGAGNGYATVHSTQNGGNQNIHVLFHYSDTVVDFTLLTAESTFSTVIGLWVGHGSIWVVVQRSNGQIQLYRLNWAAGPVLVIDPSTPVTVANWVSTGQGNPVAVLTGGLVGNQMYIAVALSYSVAGPAWVNSVTVYNFTVVGVPTSTTLTFPADQKISFTDLNFQGPQVYISISDGYTASILASPTPFSSTNELATLPGLSNAFMCSVGGTLFINAYSTVGGSINRVDLFTLVGGSLTEIGPLTVPAPLLQSLSSPEAFNGYAVFTAIYRITGSASSTISVFAYDVVRSRLFRALTFTSANFTGNASIAHGNIAVFGATTRTFPGGFGYQAQWGVAVDTESISNQTEMGREFYWGVLPQTPVQFTNLLQLSTDLTSGLIDFTAASNKLYRSILVSFIDGLVLGQATPSITCKIWFDQDPASLAAAPDITSTFNGVGQTVLPIQFLIPLNRVARKVVYEVTTTGGGVVSGVWQNAPKLVSVAVQVATGWVWDAKLDLSPMAKVNADNVQEYAFQHQSVPTAAQIDHVVAYNFLRQLWRLRGGQCVLTLPNKDSFKALVQSLAFESPKPFAASFRSDQQPNYQLIATVKIREDV